MINWLQERGLIAKSFSCPSCQHRDMKLAFTKKCSDGYRWQCGQQTRSVRSGTWFEGSHLTLQEIILVTYHWCHNAQQQHVRRALKTKSFEAVIDWYHYCRKICMEVTMRNNQKLGGPGGIVEIYESLYLDRKSSRQMTGRNQQWIIGGIDRRAGNCFMVPVEDRSLDSLENIIRDHILPGTILCTEYLNIFDDLISLEFTDYIVRHSSNLLDCVKDTNKLKSELSWRIIKRKLLTAGRKSEYLMSYLAEFIYRRNATKNHDPFISFLHVISTIYAPPLKCDGVNSKKNVEEEHAVQVFINKNIVADKTNTDESIIGPGENQCEPYGLPLAPETLTQILKLAKKSGCNKIEIKPFTTKKCDLSTTSETDNVQCITNINDMEMNHSAIIDYKTLKIENCMKIDDSSLKSVHSSFENLPNMSQLDVPFNEIHTIVQETSQLSQHTYSDATKLIQAENDNSTENEKNNIVCSNIYLINCAKKPAEVNNPIHILDNSKHPQLVDHNYHAPIGYVIDDHDYL